MAFAQYGSRLYCKEHGPGGDYCVSVRDDGTLTLSLPDDTDISQIWYKDYNDDGCFMLRNKASNRVVGYSGAGERLELVDKHFVVDHSVFWTNGEIKPSGFRSIRTSRDVDVVMSGLETPIPGDTLVTISQNSDSANQYWKLVPYSPPNYKIYSKRQGVSSDYCVSVRGGKLILTPPDHKDINQVWYKDNYDNGFALINKATGKPAQHTVEGVQLKLVSKPEDVDADDSILWTDSDDVGDGYIFIRTKSDNNVVMDAGSGVISNGTKVSINQATGCSDNEYWKFVPYSPPVFHLFCKKHEESQNDLCIGVDNQYKLILTAPKDDTQLWYMDNYHDCFALVHKATGKVVRSFGINQQLAATDKRPAILDLSSALWTTMAVNEGSRNRADNVFIRVWRDEKLVMDAGTHAVKDGTPITIAPNTNNNSDNELWNFKYLDNSDQYPLGTEDLE